MVSRYSVMEMEIKKSRRVEAVLHMECTGFENRIYIGNEREECANNAYQTWGMSHWVSGVAML